MNGLTQTVFLWEFLKEQVGTVMLEVLTPSVCGRHTYWLFHDPIWYRSLFFFGCCSHFFTRYSEMALSAKLWSKTIFDWPTGSGLWVVGVSTKLLWTGAAALQMIFWPKISQELKWVLRITSLWQWVWMIVNKTLSEPCYSVNDCIASSVLWCFAW